MKSHIETLTNLGLKVNSSRWVLFGKSLKVLISNKMNDPNLKWTSHFQGLKKRELSKSEMELKLLEESLQFNKHQQL